jgi:hypothetical protein
VDGVTDFDGAGVTEDWFPFRSGGDILTLRHNFYGYLDFSV